MRYLTAPLGYDLNVQIEENNLEELKKFAISLYDNAPMLTHKLENEDLKGIQEFFIENGFTFEESE